ncbi:hypothetical protein F7725_019965 [Dissostichus mawsoni]|uniref:Uncharacterized protein n=1 Tax=Dissostichus mawsoni TaxID=36200 RepID=A0A7J5YL73_DISMA|nr:hypothetical protein F7725_019965 [Dissostichus mawsoni]
MDDQGQRKVPGKKFHVSVAGCTNGAHQTYVNDLKGLGQIEVISPEQSDYLVLFCPIASCVGTDIGEAMTKSQRSPENTYRRKLLHIYHDTGLLCRLYKSKKHGRPGTEKGAGEEIPCLLAGCTNGAHQTYVNDLKGLGQIEVISPEQSDYLVLFCPIASCVGTDIGEAMDKISDVLFHESKMLICNHNDMAWSKG